jgi:hypothetical protein
MGCSDIGSGVPPSGAKNDESARVGFYSLVVIAISGALKTAPQLGDLDSNQDLRFQRPLFCR